MTDKNTRKPVSILKQPTDVVENNDDVGYSEINAGESTPHEDILPVAEPDVDETDYTITDVPPTEQPTDSVEDVAQDVESEQETTTDEVVVDDSDVVADKDDDYVNTDEPQKITSDYSCYTTGDDYNDVAISLPSETSNRSLNLIGTALNFNIRNDKKTGQWAYTLNAGHSLNTIDERYLSSLYGGDWHQHVMSDKGPLIGSQPRMREVNNATLSGKEAILRLMSHVGGSSNFKTPLWHTGIWVNIDPITDSDVLDLFRLISEDKINLGRYTHGAVFSNTVAFTTKRVVDFAISKIGSTTYRAAPNETIDLGKIININDIPLLINAICACMYPTGFKYNRSCMYNPKSCHHTYSGRVDFSKLVWTDMTALSKAQIKLMSSSLSGAVDDKLIKRWANDINRVSNRVVVVESITGVDVTFTLKIPTYNEYIDSGTTWLNGIADSIGDSIDIDDTDERNKFIEDNARTTILRQYTHYIESITFGDNNIIDASEDINDALDALSSDTSIRKGVIEAINKFIDETTISVVGIPSYDCPECGKGQSTEAVGIYTKVLPLDLIELFFIILIYRVRKIKSTDI